MHTVADNESDPTSNHNACSFTFKNFIGCEIQKVSDALATVEQMALGVGNNGDISPFDIVFIDADKTRLLEYTEACLANDRILKKGGYMIVDNTLYKGIVLEHTGVSTSPAQEDNASTSKAMDSGTLKRSRRAYQLAGKLHKFNKAIAKDNRCEVMILPIRDGLSLIRKK
jgi:caffeoyl-CoA O-methyltransferase